ncbi:MAG: hypothetical protein H2069_00230 [Legionella sp.]|nr:hypothetical protein [Legionella sp.]
MLKKLCIVSSCGGHLTEVRELQSIYTTYPHFYVLNDKAILANNMRDKTYFVTHSERDWKFIINLYEAYKIIKKERPHAILSTGAGGVVPFAIIGKFLFGVKILYIETWSSVERPSLTGRIMYYLADYFYYQWQPLKKFFARGEYIGSLL